MTLRITTYDVLVLTQIHCRDDDPVPATIIEQQCVRTGQVYAKLSHDSRKRVGRGLRELVPNNEDWKDFVFDLEAVKVQTLLNSPLDRPGVSV